MSAVLKSIKEFFDGNPQWYVYLFFGIVVIVLGILLRSKVLKKRARID